MAETHADQDASRPSRSPRLPRARIWAQRASEQRSPAHLAIRYIPTLRNPVLVMAFEGWNDAGEAASTAARLLVTQRDSHKFASFDPEAFFVYTDTRPYARPTRRGRRRIEWPSIDFFACRVRDDDPAARDLVILLGTEPDLRWQEFADGVVEVARRAGVQLVLALGAIQTDMPHTLPPHVSGSATNRDLHPLLKETSLKPSRYEGPTGIVGVLTSRFAEEGYPTADLWAHAPHYISASPNPVVAARLLREAAQLLEISPDMETLDEAAQHFDEQVRDAVSRDPEAMAYVQDLEKRYSEERPLGGHDDAVRSSGNDLPSGAAMVDALEEFLRKRRRPPGGGPAARE